jgi:hypothetical protein
MHKVSREERFSMSPDTDPKLPLSIARGVVGEGVRYQLRFPKCPIKPAR